MILNGVLLMLVLVLESNFFINFVRDSKVSVK